MNKNEENAMVNLAEIYRTLSEFTKNTESKELAVIFKKVKEAASNGKFTLKIHINEQVYDWLMRSSFNIREDLKPDLLSDLDKYGFTYGTPSLDINVFKTKHTMVISWKGNK